MTVKFSRIFGYTVLSLICPPKCLWVTLISYFVLASEKRSQISIRVPANPAITLAAS